jgi:hypothetical protein
MQCNVMFLVILLLGLLTSGCSTTYIPISWGMGDKVQALSRSDLTLAILFDRYDPDRQTLRVAGASFDEVMMPDEVKHHLGAYRADTKLIYRNLYQQYSDQQLRDLMVHEFAHHIWFSIMNPKQREEWGEHLNGNPTALQSFVRRAYPSSTDYRTEDFAFTVEYARPVDIQALETLKLIDAKERDALLSEQMAAQLPFPMQGNTTLSAADAEISAAHNSHPKIGPTPE